MLQLETSWVERAQRWRGITTQGPTLQLEDLTRHQCLGMETPSALTCREGMTYYFGRTATARDVEGGDDSEVEKESEDMGHREGLSNPSNSARVSVSPPRLLASHPAPRQ